VSEGESTCEERKEIQVSISLYSSSMNGQSITLNGGNGMLHDMNKLRQVSFKRP